MIKCLMTILLFVIGACGHHRDVEGEGQRVPAFFLDGEQSVDAASIYKFDYSGLDPDGVAQIRAELVRLLDSEDVQVRRAVIVTLISKNPIFKLESYEMDKTRAALERYNREESDSGEQIFIYEKNGRFLLGVSRGMN